MTLKRLQQSFTGKLTAFILIYLIIALAMSWIIVDDWTRTGVSTKTVSMGYLLPASEQVEQTFTAEMDELEWLVVTPHFDAQERTGNAIFALYEGDTMLWQGEINAAALLSDQENEVTVAPALSGVQGKTLTLRIDPAQTGMALWAGTTVSAGKFDVAVQAGGLTAGGEAAQGSLVMTVGGVELLNAGRMFWPLALVLLAVAVALIILTHHHMEKGVRTPFTVLVSVCRRYSYLLNQLVWRDFRVKYKASVLGMLWSFLNPLLTMLVYYFVFSTLFHSDVEYFPVYLMSGIVLFNYFSEASSLGLNAIVGNSALITKVYMPKVIYPLSKVLSSAINLCISFIPLLLVMLITGVPFSKSILLIPVVVLFLLIFCLGVSLILATMNVFFRDTQFLWSVLITMWNFLTPIFYPESIIPQQFLQLYHMNPMYQIVYFMRSITIGGVSPTPITYIYCTIASVGTLLLGLWIFRKNQDRFVLHL